MSAAELELAAAEVYHNPGDWLLQKTDEDIENRFRAVGTRRAAKGVGLHQFVWALITSRDHVWHFLSQEAFAGNIVELYGELELHQMLTQLFDRAVYYGIQGYGAQNCTTMQTVVAHGRVVKTGLINSPDAELFAPDADSILQSRGVLQDPLQMTIEDSKTARQGKERATRPD